MEDFDSDWEEIVALYSLGMRRLAPYEVVETRATDSCWSCVSPLLTHEMVLQDGSTEYLCEVCAERAHAIKPSLDF